MTRFEDSLAEVLRHEGGYVDHPRDPGGATNMGITRKTLARWRGISPWWKLPKEEVRALTRTEAARIYRALYWDRCRAALFAPGLDLALFDFAVNSGPTRAVQHLQGLLGTRADGVVGPLTLAAVREEVGKNSVGALIRALCQSRMRFLSRLGNFATFGRGWTRRVATIQLRALAVAGVSSQSDTDQNLRRGKSPMDILSGYKTYIVALAMLIAGLGQMLGVDLPGFNGQSSGQLMIEALAILFLRKGIKSDILNT
ncbi:MAG TPA: acetylmuramidase [Devosia sp.]|nr:acetylmuramidase [Devosia sp.]